MDILIVIGTVIFIVASVIGYFIGKARSGIAFAVMAAVVAGFVGLMFLGMDQATGWDGMIYLVGLIGGAAPAAVGLLGGGFVGLAKAPQDAAPL